jgi:hypothetical protein
VPFEAITKPIPDFSEEQISEAETTAPPTLSVELVFISETKRSAASSGTSQTTAVSETLPLTAQLQRSTSESETNSSPISETPPSESKSTTPPSLSETPPENKTPLSLSENAV